MLGDNGRICDVCGEGIAKGDKYRVVHIPPEAASLFLDAGDIDLIPTWVQYPDKTVRLDICPECTISMG